MENNQMALVSLISGIFSVLCLGCGPISLITSIIAIVTGFMGIKAASMGGGGKGMAIGGIVLGGVYWLLFIASMILLFAFGGLGVIMEMMR